MITWVLILTLVAPGSTGGSAIASVPGFSSLDECSAAGNEWLRKLPRTWSGATAICSSQTKR